MKKKIKIIENRMTPSVLLVIFMIFSVFANAQVCEEQPDLQSTNIINFSDNNQDTITMTLSLGAYEIKNKKGSPEIFIEDFARLSVPGKPNLPSRIFTVAIPPGSRFIEVDFDTGNDILLSGTYDISPTPLPRVISGEDPLVYEQDQKLYEETYNMIYGCNDPHHSSIVEFIDTAGYRNYNLVDIRVTPFIYYPSSGQLIYHPEITVYVRYELAEKQNDCIKSGQIRTEKTASELIINYDQAKNWYCSSTGMNEGIHDFVIITLDSLVSSVTPLTNWEIYKGRTVKVVNISWINSSYLGYDLAEKIRNFLREKYPTNEWGIEDVLIVGHPDDIPMRRTWQDVGYGQPATDFYYAELSLPDNESWDADGDHQYGEYSDPIDIYPEVNVGRIPWSDPDIVLSICNKSVAYEQNNNPAYKKNILLLGAFFWSDTDNAKLMELVSTFPWMSDWAMTKMYEKNLDYLSIYNCDYPLSSSNVMSIWPNETFAFVNWAGHGSPISSHILGLGMPSFISSNNCSLLNDNYPSIIFADSCSNSDIDYFSIGQAMLKQGAVGFLGATKIAYGMPAWDHPYDGSTQSLDYFFTKCVTSRNYTIGGAHQWALREMYVNGLWSNLKYETFEWGTLFGNPNLGMTSVDFADIAILSITGGFGIKVVVKNIGSADAVDVEWNVTVNGGLMVNSKNFSGLISTLSPCESAEIDISLFGIGLGLITDMPIINVTVNMPYLSTVEATVTARIVGPFVMIQ